MLTLSLNLNDLFIPAYFRVHSQFLNKITTMLHAYLNFIPAQHEANKSIIKHI